MAYRTCPRPDKRGFPNSFAADHEMRRITKTRHRNKKPQRVYECDCGLWHLTSRLEPLGETA